MVVASGFGESLGLRLHGLSESTEMECAVYHMLATRVERQLLGNVDSMSARIYHHSFPLSIMLQLQTKSSLLPALSNLYPINKEHDKYTRADLERRGLE